jgi:hypothetical protein
VLFIDKNHIPNNIHRSVKVIRQYCQGVNIIGMVPVISNPMINSPFSADCVIQSLQRVLLRDDSHTLNGGEDPIKAMQVFFMFLKGFSNVKFN